MKVSQFLYRIQSSDRLKQQMLSGTSLRSNSQTGDAEVDQSSKKNQSTKRYLKFSNTKKDPVYSSNSMKSSNGFLSKNKHFQTLSSFEKLKKSVNSTRIDDVRKVLNFDKSQTNAIKDMKHFLQLTKKMQKGSQKLINNRDSKSTCIKQIKQIQNNPLRHNTITNQNADINFSRNTQQNSFKNFKIMNKKDCMKMFHRKKDAPSISEHHIEEVPHDFVQKTETNLKETHPFSKSNSIFFRNKPYLNFNHQKKEKGEDKIQQQSENDVSIQISEGDGDANKNGTNDERPESFPSLNQSQIQENNMDNDSSFLGNSDKKMIQSMIKEESKLKKKKKSKKHWKKLPDDFMK